MARTVRRLLPWLLVLGGASGVGGAAGAGQVTLYRCTDAAGQLTVQSQPCPPGSQQREQTVGGVSSTPARPTPPASTTLPADGAAPHADPATGSNGEEGFRLLDSAVLARERAQAATDAQEAARPPPPPLYRCLRREGDRYLSESATPPPRCEALRTVGLDGNPATGAGQACEVVRDQCEAVAGPDACAAWRDHARQAQTRWRLAHPDNVAWRREDYARIAAIVAASCGE